MAFFTTRIRHSRLTLSPFSSEQMADIGEDVIGSIVGRISEAKDANDNPAKPLSAKYAKWKSSHGAYTPWSQHGQFAEVGYTSKGNLNSGHNPVRDWTLRGKTLSSVRVKVASEDRCTIGPTDEESAMIISVQDARSHQWGVSPTDESALVAATRRQLETNMGIREEPASEVA